MTWLLQDPVLQPSKLKFLRGRHLATNSLGLGKLFSNQVASSKILGAMATKMVASWRVVLITQNDSPNDTEEGKYNYRGLKFES